MRIWRTLAQAFCASAAAVLPTGCISIQAIEPVMTPPQQFLFDTTTEIEFAAGPFVGLRCADRGAKFLGLPAVNAGACSDDKLITMIDPCLTLTAGAYAKVMCADMAEWRAGPTKRDVAAPGIVRISQTSPKATPHAEKKAAERKIGFYGASEIAQECRYYGVTPIEADGVTYCSTGAILIISNPCSRTSPGWYETTLCHELAHVNGWSPEHNGGTPRLALRPASQSEEAMNAAALMPALTGRR